MEHKFNAHAALKHQSEVMQEQRDCVSHAIDLIYCDRPNEAARFLQKQIMEGAAGYRIQEEKLNPTIDT